MTNKLYTDTEDFRIFLSIHFTVEVNEDNLEMYISTDPSAVPGAPGGPVMVGSDVILTDGTPYYVDCVVREATPAPSSITATLSAGTNPAAVANSWFTDHTDSNDMSAILTVERYSFTPTFGMHRGETLTCTAGNEANELLNDHNPTTYPATVDKVVTLVVHRK